MGYLFAVLSVLSNAAKGACSKFVSSDIATLRQNTCFNAVRNVLCTLIAFAIVLTVDGGRSLAIAPIEILLCGISGAVMALFTFAWTFAVKSDAYMLVSACNSASFVIPCIFGFTLLGERLTLHKFLAFVIILVALYFLLRHNFSLKGKITFPQAILLFCIFLSTGTYQAMQKIYAVNVSGKDIAYYTFYTFAASAVFLIVATLLLKKESSAKMSGILRKNTVFLLIMAVGNFASSYFQGIAAKTVDSIILFPMINALSLIAGGLVSSLLFKERITKSCAVGLVLVFVALVLSRI